MCAPVFSDREEVLLREAKDLCPKGEARRMACGLQCSKDICACIVCASADKPLMRMIMPSPVKSA